MNNLHHNHKKDCLSNSGLFFLALVFTLPAWAATEAPAQPLSEQERSTVAELNNATRRVVEIVSPAVVSISVLKNIEPGPFFPGGESISLGSGCIIDKRGYIITNNHVVADTDKVEVILGDGRRFTAAEKMFDPDTDLAIVRIDPGPENLPTAAFGDSDQSQVGDFVLAMGSPFGLVQTVTAGIISHKGRQTGILDKKWGYEDFIQTDADINKGNSGGPLVNLYGEVIGINSNIFSPTGISTGYGFAVPSNIAKFVAESLIADKQVKRGWLGVKMISVDDLRKMTSASYGSVPDPQLRQFVDDNRDFIAQIPESLHGILAFEVMEGDPADQAGMKAKDIIISVNGKELADSGRFRSFIATLAPGKSAPFVIWREGREITLKVAVGDRAVARGKYSESPYITQEESELKPDKIPFPFLPGPFEQPEPAKPKLGVTVQPLNPELAQRFGYSRNLRGIVIRQVQPGSVAEHNGLEVGDIIVSVNGVKIKDHFQLKEIIQKADLEEGLEMELRNQQGKRTITLKRRADLIRY